MQIRRKPERLQKKVSPTAHSDMDHLLGGLQLNTVCRQASCPNISECFQQKQATFLIMGKECTRGCRFCNLSRNVPGPLDQAEPARVAEAVQKLGLRHVVVTSPTRDDLPDGGAGHLSATVGAIRTVVPAVAIELLIPDFQGIWANLETVIASRPNILGHNIETVPRLYAIRTGADYGRSLLLLETAGKIAPGIPTKTGIMLGLGETRAEITATLEEIRKTGCRYLSMGQYLAPSRRHYPVAEFIAPEEFDRYRDEALAMGFDHVESGPYVRSSYHAERYGGESLEE
jgi:lipoic acid synthetase